MKLTLDAAIEDYLHLIIRTRPWTKQREAEQLEPFCEWVYEQPELSFELASLTPAVSERYRQSVGLSDDDHDELDTTLRKLLLWAELRGFVDSNGFAGHPAAITH